MNAAANPLVLLLARVYLAALFVVAGYNKITNIAGTTGYLGKLGVPAPGTLVWIVIAIELLGGLLIVVGWKTRWVAWVMAGFTLATAILGHAFWSAEGAQFASQMTQFLKNIAIMGGFMLLAVAGPGRFSVDKG
jgi:putative oxidoreductase